MFTFGVGVPLPVIVATAPEGSPATVAVIRLVAVASEAAILIEKVPVFWHIE